MGDKRISFVTQDDNTSVDRVELVWGMWRRHRAKTLGFLARVGLYPVIEYRNSLALAGGRTRRRFANFNARFGVHTDELWASS